MPKKTDNAAVETEKGFGTGLRTKLEGRRPEPARKVAKPPDPEAEPAEPEVVAEEAPEPTETEQLWSELEESLAREEALRHQLEEQANAYAETRELGLRLAERGEAIQRREQELETQLRALEQEAAKPAQLEHGRAYLRRRVEENGESLWRVFQEGLTATKANGEPDYRLRLLAASALLAEAYADTPGLSPGEQVAAARDELAGIRAKRATKPR